MDNTTEDKKITKALYIADVSGSYFELVFGNHLKAKMIIENGKMKVVAAVNGWGDSGLDYPL